MLPEELKTIQAKFRQGIEKLELLSQCLTNLAEKQGFDITIEGLDRTAGELTFWFSGARYYIHIRITDRDVDDMEPGFRVPMGQLDWGRYYNGRETPDQTNYYDERGILCELEKEEFYCSFGDCDDPRVAMGITSVLKKMVTRTIAINNAGG